MILIADDSRFMRAYLKQLFQKQGSLHFVEVANGEQAILLYRLLSPAQLHFLLSSNIPYIKLVPT